MKKSFKKAMAWLRAQRGLARERRRMSAERRLERMSEREVQVMEYGGTLYIAHGGVPLLPVDGLKWDIGAALAAMRGAYVEWHGRESL